MQNCMLGQNSKRKKISLAVDDVPLTGIQTVNHFNAYFTSVASDLVGILSNNNIHPYGDNNLNATCVLRETSEDELKKVLRSFEGKRYHRDDIQPSILIKVNDVISPILSNTYNKCILSSVYPDKLKRVRVVLLFKSGDSNLASNYHPISTLSIFNKVFEKLIHLRLSKFLTTNNVISNTQFGFRKNVILLYQFFYLVAGLLKSFHDKPYCICLFLDLRKAFDTVNVEILVEKLKMHGIRGTACLLINSFSSNMDQYDVCDD